MPHLHILTSHLIVSVSRPAVRQHGGIGYVAVDSGRGGAERVQEAGHVRGKAHHRGGHVVQGARADGRSLPRLQISGRDAVVSALLGRRQGTTAGPRISLRLPFLLYRLWIAAGLPWGGELPSGYERGVKGCLLFRLNLFFIEFVTCFYAVVVIRRMMIEKYLADLRGRQRRVGRLDWRPRPFHVSLQPLDDDLLLLLFFFFLSSRRQVLYDERQVLPSDDSGAAGGRRRRSCLRRWRRRDRAQGRRRDHLSRALTRELRANTDEKELVSRVSQLRLICWSVQRKLCSCTPRYVM